MSNTKYKFDERAYDALHEELENRYGPAIAQAIIDQIKKADHANHDPDVLQTKAVGEALALFRTETREIVKKLKNIRQEQNLPSNVPSLEEKRLKDTLNQKLAYYWLCQQSFYKLYAKVLKICEVPMPYRHDWYVSETEMKTAA